MKIGGYKRSRLGRTISLLAVCILWFCASVEARELSRDTVKAAVENWVRHVTAGAREHAVIEKMQPYIIDRKIVAYIAHLKYCGFCICGADDTLLPVYLYNPEGEYNPQSPSYSYILQEIEARRKHLDRLQKREPGRHEEALAERAAYWRELAAGRIPVERVDDAGIAAPGTLELPLTAKWDQGGLVPSINELINVQEYSFNGMCPILTPATYSNYLSPGNILDERCRVGCPAIAMSQVMYYWRWPTHGQGSDYTTYTYRWRPSLSSTWTQVYVDPAQCTISDDWPWRGRLEWSENYNYLGMKGYWDESLYERAQNLYSDWSESDHCKYQDALTTLWNLTPNTTTTQYEANFAETTYPWDLMVDAWDPALSDDAKDAMRLLCYHAGVAAETEYGVTATGNGEATTCSALKDHFRYDSDATIYDPGATADALDERRIREEILWLRPVIIRGTKINGGGHYWVIYGYKTITHQFKMNMGWGEGEHACWYTLDDSDLEYTEDQKYLIQVAPNNVKFVGADNQGDGSPDDPYGDIEEAVTEAPDNSVLIFRANSANTFSVNALTIDRPLTLKGYNATIYHQ